MKLVKILKKKYNPTGRLNQDYKSFNTFEILISTILSQRTRDENTERASRNLFSKYNTPNKLSSVGLKELEKLIKPAGFYKVKAKRIKEVSKVLLKEYNGKVPNVIEKLLKLPGVGRKTANCVLVYGFKTFAIPVDTHVHRISNRIGLVKTKTPEQTEIELIKVIPKKYWIDLNELFVRHGQEICQPRKPLCYKCPIVKLCNYKFKNL